MTLLSRLMSWQDRRRFANECAAFERDGYVILRGAVDPAQIDSFWEEVGRLQDSEPGLTYSQQGKIIRNEDVLSGALEDVDASRLRITCVENYSALAPDLMLHPAISGFLTAVYGMRPACIQTLTYKYSSQQGTHSDKYLVSPRSVGANYDRDSLTAAWVACDEVSDENGALIIYPGSHKLEKKRLKEDFNGRYNDYVQYLEALCAEHGITPERFHAKKGDVLFWHGDFAHAGGPILNPDMTRLSLVAHYARLEPKDPGAGGGRVKRAHANGWYFVDEQEDAA